jgi:hypothetical protein
MTEPLRERRARHLDALRARLGHGTVEQEDWRRADRAIRLDAFFETEVWKVDVLPLLGTMLEEARSLGLAESGPTRDEMAGYQKAIEDLTERLGAQVWSGQQAIARIRQRQEARGERPRSGETGT